MIIVIIMGSIDKGMSMIAWPAMVSTGKVNFIEAWLKWTFGTSQSTVLFLGMK